MTGSDEYQRRFDVVLQVVAKALQEHIAILVRGATTIDQITARAKDPESFARKAAKEEGGKPKYGAPLTEIQDQLGVRIVVFYKRDVGLVSERILRYFSAIEEKELIPESYWEFGYFGEHLVLAMPADVIPREVDPAEVPRFFELQIKTLFQHAWSQANHDLGYKATRALTGYQERRLAFTSAQAWGADREFESLRAELMEE